MLMNVFVITWTLLSWEKVFISAWNLPFSNTDVVPNLQVFSHENIIPQSPMNTSVRGSRRSILSIPLWLLPLFIPQNSHADSTAVEAIIRRSASKIPGYGEADVYYPQVFSGKWSASQTIITWDESGFLDGTLPLLSLTLHQKIRQQFVPLTLKYTMRFISVDGTTDKIVADRAYNEQAFYEALLNLRTDIPSSSERTIQDIQWSDTNPNVLSTLYRDGSVREVKVTKRATTMNEEQGLVMASEYRRITTSLNTLDGRNLPSITGSRILTKWKVADDHIDGIELIYSDGQRMGDPLASDNNIPSAASTTLVCKSLLRLMKIEADT